MIVYDVAIKVLDICGITFIVLFRSGEAFTVEGNTHTHTHTHTHKKGREYAKVIHGSV